MLKSKSSRWLAGPYLVWMAIFTVVPLFIVIWYAMTNADGQFTFDNLTQIGRYSSVFAARSLILAAISTVICLVMAFPVGYFLSRLRANKQHIMLMLIMLPMWMNFLLRTYAWMTLLEKNGLINKFFGLFGLGPFNMINTSGAVVLGMVYNYLPFMILPIYTAMTKIDDSIIEAAQDLGLKRLAYSVSGARPADRPRHCHRHHAGVRARSLYFYYQPYAGRRLQPADR